MFVHLRGRATYSMLEGIGAHDDILQRAESYGQDSLAVTDLYGLYGAVDFYNKAKKYNIRPIVGVEIPYTPDIHVLSNKRDIIKTLGTITLIATSKQGYHNLLEIVSGAYDQALDDLPCIDNALLQGNTTDMILLMGGLYSHIYQLVSLHHNLPGAESFIDTMIQLFGQANVCCDITAQPYSIYESLSETNDYLIAIAQDRELSAVVTSGYCYPSVDYKQAYETALAIKDNKKIYDPDHRTVSGEHHLLSEEEIRDILMVNGYGQDMITRLVDQTYAVAQGCQISIDLGQMLFPNYETSEHIRVLYDSYQHDLIVM